MPNPKLLLFIVEANPASGFIEPYLVELAVTKDAYPAQFLPRVQPVGSVRMMHNIPILPFLHPSPGGPASRAAGRQGETSRRAG